MSRKFVLGLFLAGLLVVVLAASLERAPGYMDAEYYYAGALRLVSGQGASEPYIWNYLNAPSALPAPSFSYWMPLVSLVAAGGLALAPGLGWWGARLLLILLAACIAPLTALLSLRLTGRPAAARLAGLLALFPGFYLAFLPTTDAFVLTMLLGGLFMLLVLEQAHWTRLPLEAGLFGLGLLAGLLHLGRADGLLWLGAAGLVALARFSSLRKAGGRPQAVAVWRLGTFLLAVFLGYGLVMAPWFARNLSVWGSLMPPGSSHALWITEYEETMSYPASLLTPQHWLAAGWGAHLRAWGDALLNHLQTAVAVQGGILLFPFILAGLWRLRGCLPVRLGVLMYLMTLAAMTLAFPLAGKNGGFFHSGAALQLLFWAVAPLGLETIIGWYVQKRRLAGPQGLLRFMSALLVGGSLLLSVLLYAQRVVGSQPDGLAWGSNSHYQQVEAALVNLGAQPGEAVLVNNPPGYWLASGRPAAVIPDGDEQTLVSAARQYAVRYVVLEITNPPELGNLYQNRAGPPELTYLTSVGSTHLFRVETK